MLPSVDYKHIRYKTNLLVYHSRNIKTRSLLRTNTASFIVYTEAGMGIDHNPFARGAVLGTLYTSNSRCRFDRLFSTGINVSNRSTTMFSADQILFTHLDVVDNTTYYREM